MKGNLNLAVSLNGMRRIILVCGLLALVWVLAAPGSKGGISNNALQTTAALRHPMAVAAMPGTAPSNVSNGNQKAGVPMLRSEVKIGRSVKNDVTPPLRDMPLLTPPANQPNENDNENPVVPMPQPGEGAMFKDPILQKGFGGGSPLSMPNALLSYDGLSNSNNGGSPVSPPDTNGVVGYYHYIQVVNKTFAIWDKSGNRVYGPAWTNSLWQGFGGYCESHNDGDPVVVFDQLAGRWVISQFAVGSSPSYAPSYECIAVSTSYDPTGSWYRYSFLMSNDTLYDYPKLSMWTGSYFMTANMFNNGNFTGGAAIAFDRNGMSNGQSSYYLEVDTPYYSMLPSNLDGNTLPPDNSPDYMMAIADSTHLALWTFHADWQNPGNSYLAGPSLIGVAQYDSTLCGATREQCISQPGTSTMLEGKPGQLMHRLAYRNFGDHESLVLNHTVNVENGLAGIRWYEIRSPGTSPTVYQQGTYAPDSDNRWMGSIAQDGDGDIALGASRSSATLYPTIIYAGRLANDPLGVLAQGEGVMQIGTGAQSTGNRWGDYSSMTVDPVDDCTFWYTTEYYATTGTNWNTRIGTFRFPSCGVPHTSTATATRTSTPPPTITSTPTASPTSTSIPLTCGPTSNYIIAQGTGTIVPGTADIGNHCDDCVTTIGLPFPYSLYDQSFSTASVSSNGQLDFLTADSNYYNTCLPDAAASYAIFPDWSDLDTENPGEGIFTSITGTAPNRIFNIEWRAEYYDDGAPANFEVRLYEGQQRFDVIYGAEGSGGVAATIGVQKGTGSRVTQFECNTGGITSGLQLIFTQPPCSTSTPTNTPTNTPTGTRSPSPTNTPTRTNTPTDTSTPTVTRTSTPTPTPACVQTFSGSITSGDLSHPDDLNLYDGHHDSPSQCGVQESTPPLQNLPNLSWHYDPYVFRNTSGSSQCVTVVVDGSQCGGPYSKLWAFAYLNSFDPNNIQANYLADASSLEITSLRTFSFMVPANSSFVVIVQEFGQNGFCNAYTMTISGLYCATPTNTPIATNTPTITSTPTNSVTLSATPTVQNTVNGHLTWQGITQPNTRNNGLAANLTLCVNGAPATYAVTSDQNGNFSLTLNLPNGAYNWWLKGNRWLTNSGTFTLAGGTNSYEFGTLRAGDANDSNVVNTTDFNILKSTFGTSSDLRADFNNDGVVNTIDFNLLKGNFGQAGAVPSCP